jgi:two-component system, cell cycle response regulator
MGVHSLTEYFLVGRPTSRSCPEACLVQIYPTGPGMGLRHRFNSMPVILGRGEDCGIFAQDHSVSRRHARVELVGDGYVVTDLCSTNGTSVNDRPAMGTPLADGDYLRAGNCLFRFLAGGNVEAEYHEELYRLAIIDALTGLHNNRYLLEYLGRETTRSARHDRPLALILLDIDHFKAINDTLGHLAGDLALRELARRLLLEVRRDELLARYGGEEFALVLGESSLEEATEVAERFRRAVKGHTLSFEGKSFSLTISLGVAWTPGGEVLETDQLIRRADERLYRAKREGRNRVAC